MSESLDTVLNKSYPKEIYLLQNTQTSLKPLAELKSSMLDLKFSLNYSNPDKVSVDLDQKIHRYNGLTVAQNLYTNLTEISDTVLEEGLPVKTTLFLYERVTGKLLKTTESNHQGIFKFYNLNADLNYVITANDDKYQFKSILKNYNQ